MAALVDLRRCSLMPGQSAMVRGPYDLHLGKSYTVKALPQSILRMARIAFPTNAR